MIASVAEEQVTAWLERFDMTYGKQEKSPTKAAGGKSTEPLRPRQQIRLYLALKEMARAEVLSRARHSPSGNWSAEGAARRILAIARRLAQEAGCDPKILCNAAMRGINEAEAMLKGSSWACSETRRLVKKGFDNWDRLQEAGVLV